VAGSTQVVNLTGTGISPGITVNPTSLAFGNTGTGPLLGGRNLSTVVTNNGSVGSLLVLTTQITGTNASLFTVTGNTCPAGGLARNATCTITVRFRPTTTGAKVGQLRINSNAPTTPTILNMTGNGVFSL
jgi:hypothetical protein